MCGRPEFCPTILRPSDTGSHAWPQCRIIIKSLPRGTEVAGPMDISRRGFLEVSAVGVGISGLGFDLKPAYAVARQLKI